MRRGGGELEEARSTGMCTSVKSADSGEGETDVGRREEEWCV
jgi:hypothetical protein